MRPKKLFIKWKNLFFDQKNYVRLKFLVLHTKKWVVGRKNLFSIKKKWCSPQIFSVTHKKMSRWMKKFVFWTKKLCLPQIFSVSHKKMSHWTKKFGLRLHFLKFWTTFNPQTRKVRVTPQKVGSEPQKWVPNPKNGGFWPQKREGTPQKGGYPPKWGVETKWRFLGVEFHGFFLKIWSLKTMVFCRVRSKLCSGLRGTPRKLDPFLPNFDQKMGVF